CLDADSGQLPQRYVPEVRPEIVADVLRIAAAGGETQAPCFQPHIQPLPDRDHLPSVNVPAQQIGTRRLRGLARPVSATAQPLPAAIATAGQLHREIPTPMPAVVQPRTRHVQATPVRTPAPTTLVHTLLTHRY